MKRSPTGFTLLELLVGMVIVTIGVSAAMPSFLAEGRRGEVDRPMLAEHEVLAWEQRPNSCTSAPAFAGEAKVKYEPSSHQRCASGRAGTNDE